MIVVSNQLISLASRELILPEPNVLQLNFVSNQLISLASREIQSYFQRGESNPVSNQLISLASRETNATFKVSEAGRFQSINFPSE